MLTAACSPGALDGESSINGAPGYSFVDTGGHGRVIVFGKPGEPAQFVVQSRVDGYSVRDGKILVARLPMKSDQAAPSGWITEGPCQYLSIDIASRRMSVLPDPIAGLSCRPAIDTTGETRSLVPKGDPAASAGSEKGR